VNPSSIRPAPAHAAAALAALLACGEAAAPASARIDAVDGALEPILVHGQRAAIEGFGFGPDPGVVRFPRQGGGEVDAPAETWTETAVTTVVPPNAASGPLALETGAGRRITAPVHVLPATPFDTAQLTWAERTPFPAAPVGVALAAAELPGSAGLATVLYAAGGAEPVGTPPTLVPDSGVYLARVQAGGALGAWTRQRDAADPFQHRNLPAPRAFAAAAVATRHNSRFGGHVLYLIGGVDAAGRAQATVFAADVTADSVASRFLTIEPLPAPVAGAIALVRRGRLYVAGGTDAAGRPGTRVFVGRIGPDGHIDGWYEAPPLPAPRAYGGGVALDHQVAVFGGVADSVPPGGGLDPTPPRLVTSDTAAVSLVSGFFRGPWAAGPTLLPAARSQFATLTLGTAVLVVGGVYAGADQNAAETLIAPLDGDGVGPFQGPVGRNTIAGEGGGTVVGPAGITWRESDGRRRGLVLGGMDLASGQRTAKSWGF
jgi:hypothetical protein